MSNNEEKEYLTYYLLGKLNCSFEDDVLIQKKMYLLRFLGVDLGYKFIWDDKQGVCSPELDDALDDLSLHRPQHKDETMFDCGYGPLCTKVNNLYFEAAKRKVKVDQTLWYQLVTDTVFLRNHLPKDKVLKAISQLNLPEYDISQYQAAYLTARNLKRKR